jgi:hypothetical protein
MLCRRAANVFGYSNVKRYEGGSVCEWPPRDRHRVSGANAIIPPTVERFRMPCATRSSRTTVGLTCSWAAG